MSLRSILLALISVSLFLSATAMVSASITARKSADNQIVFGAVQYAPPALHSTVFSAASASASTDSTRSTSTAAPSSAADFIVANLRAYLAFVAEATATGVDVLVFPEGTLGWIAAESRDALVPYCAQLPAARPSVEPVREFNQNGRTRSSD